jgi:hypothetical protein
MEDILPVATFVGSFAFFAGFIALVWMWHFKRSSYLLEQWAARNDFRILSRQYRFFFKGPFFWTSSRGQVVYCVIVLDSDGDTRKGWVRCGGWLLGLLSDRTEVRWDD